VGRFSVLRWFAVTFCVGLSVASASTARTIYECQIEQRGPNRGWLPEVVVVAYEPGADEVQVSDPMIQYVHGKPIAVKVKKDSDARLSLSWKLVLPSTSQDELRLTFDFSILKAERRARIKATPHGYDNTFDSQGTCKVLKG
jgi:hypothetical protein